MKTKNYLFILFLLFFVVGFAQKSDNSTPKSVLFNLTDDNEIESYKKEFPTLDLNILQAQDEIDEQKWITSKIWVSFRCKLQFGKFWSMD